MDSAGILLPPSSSDSDGLDWDPLANTDTAPPTAAALRRIQKELKNYIAEPIEGIYFLLDDEKANLIHALIVGPPETPYEGGFFYFLLRIPSTYPFKPPLLKLMTTGGGEVGFNPNLYADGKVCLSILGTWPGPSWTPNIQIRTALLSIQSLMGNDPYFNEPGYEGTRNTANGKEASEQYNDQVRYETMRVAVLGMMNMGIYSESHQMPQALKDIMKGIFTSKVDFYMAVILQNQQSNTQGFSEHSVDQYSRYIAEINVGKNTKIKKYRKLQESLNKLIGGDNTTTDEPEDYDDEPVDDVDDDGDGDDNEPCPGPSTQPAPAVPAKKARRRRRR